MSNTPDRIRWAGLAIMVAIAFGLYVLDSTGNMDGLLRFLRDPAASLSGVAADPAQSVSSALDAPRSLAEANERIASLEAQVAVLSRENEELRELEGEYAVLANLFDYARESPLTSRVLADVIGRDPNPLFQSIIINKGFADGVRIGMPVDSERGMVGQVFRVNEHSAMVLLITDASSSVPSRLSESRSVGLVHGGGLGNPMTMDWIPLEDEVAVGDVALTSGLIGEFVDGAMVNRFPPGLIMGRVSAVRRSEAEILQTAEIQSAVDFGALEKVFVITGFPQEDLSGFEDPLGEGAP
ncbi:MAG: rod shape-determining protein MreC [Anaerolineales bacterium]|nr:rod shape-determining protein MreC [Anaerolineales bacterium]